MSYDVSYFGNWNLFANKLYYSELPELRRGNNGVTHTCTYVCSKLAQYTPLYEHVSHKSWSNPYIIVQYTGNQCESFVK